MLLKTFVTGAAAVALVGTAAASVPTSTAVRSATSAITPVVRQIPLPQQPAPVQAPTNQTLIDTLNGLAAPGTFGGAKASYIQGGVGRIQAISADSAYNNAVAKGVLPMTFSVSNLLQKDDTVTADVTAKTADGRTTTESVSFVAGPSPSGWQLSRSSALALLSAMR